MLRIAVFLALTFSIACGSRPARSHFDDWSIESFDGSTLKAHHGDKTYTAVCEKREVVIEGKQERPMSTVCQIPAEFVGRTTVDTTPDGWHFTMAASQSDDVLILHRWKGFNTMTQEDYRVISVK